MSLTEYRGQPFHHEYHRGDVWTIPAHPADEISPDEFQLLGIPHACGRKSLAFGSAPPLAARVSRRGKDLGFWNRFYRHTEPDSMLSQFARVGLSDEFSEHFSID
jgi:hypothetical protein